MRAVTIVEDNPLDAEILARIVARTGQEARVYSDETPLSDGTFNNQDGILVLDFMLPDSDGFENLRHLARNGFCGRVVLITGEAFEYLATARQYGRDLGLDVTAEMKPIDIDRMTVLLSRPAGAS